MDKIKISNDVCQVPMPVTLVGAKVNGKANFMAVAWMTRANARPPIFAVCIGQRQHTAVGIRENETFSINVPSVDLVQKTDYCGLVSGRTVDKSALFTVFYGELGNAPMIAECPVCIECRLMQTTTLPSDFVFFGEVVAVHSEERYLSGGKLDPSKLNPFVLTMPGDTYWALGDAIADAFNVGKRLKRE